MGILVTKLLNYCTTNKQFLRHMEDNFVLLQDVNLYIM